MGGITPSGLGWGFLALIGLLLIVSGVLGNSGTLLACIFCPGDVSGDDQDQGGQS